MSLRWCAQSNRPAGIGLPKLVARVPIAPKRIERLLHRHANYFVKIPANGVTR